MRFKLVVILAGLAVFLAACATNKKISAASTIERMGVVYRINADQPFTGMTTSYYLDGAAATTIEYRDGLKDGRQIEWLRNGRKSELMTWRKGVRDGEQSDWYENEQKAFQGSMQQGKWVGECCGWYPDGRLAFQVRFQDGQGRGQTIVIKWNKENIVREFPDVLVDGDWIEWNELGRVTRREQYRAGKLIAKFK